MITWGSQQLNLSQYEQMPGPTRLRERQLLAAPGDPTPQSVLMGTGRERRRIRAQAWAPRDEWVNLRSDAETQQRRTLTLEDGSTFDAFLVRVGAAVKRLPVDVLFFDIEFVEA